MTTPHLFDGLAHQVEERKPTEREMALARGISQSLKEKGLPAVFEPIYPFSILLIRDLRREFDVIVDTPRNGVYPYLISKKTEKRD